MKRMETLVRRMRWQTSLWMKKMNTGHLPSTFYGFMCISLDAGISYYLTKCLYREVILVEEGGVRRKEGTGGHQGFPHLLCWKLMKYLVMLMNSFSSVSKV